MKIPEKAPDWWETIKKEAEVVFNVETSLKLLEITKKANQKYLYWDDFKYLTMPQDISIEAAWAYLKFNRSSQLKVLPAKDNNGQQFKYWLPNIVLKHLHFIDKSCGRALVDNPYIEQDKDRYMISSLMEEAIASSQLEGAATTRKKAKELLRSGRPPKTPAEKMIFNNYMVISDIKRLLQEPLTPDLLKRLQATITKDTLVRPDGSGRFRNSEENDYHVISPDGNILHTPCPSHEIDERIKALCEYANDEDETEFVHPIIKGIILHFWLAYIHPFIDGNGRTSRALFYWYVLKNGYWLFEFLAISRIILRAPAQYANAYLYSEVDEQDATYFIIYNLKAISLAIDALHVFLKKQQVKLKEGEKLLRKYPGLNHRQHELLNHAISHPDNTYTLEYYKNLFGVVYETARRDLIALEKEGLLDRTKSGRAYYFIPSKTLHEKLKKIEQTGAI
jgi:Fic family protein